MHEVVELRSLSGSKFGFMVPIFARQGSNQAFAQDLDHNGIVKQFLPIDAGQYRKCDWLPPPLTLDVGDFGVLAFMDSNEVGQLMSLSDMRDFIANLNIDDPLTKLEAAALLEDRALLKEAVDQCLDAYPLLSNSITWAAREEASFGRAIALQNSTDRKSTAQDALTKDFLEIETDFEIERWSQIWVKLWTQGFDKNKLSGLAYYIIDAGRKIPSQFSHVILNIVRHTRERSILDRAISFIKVSNEIDGGIVDLFNVLSHIVVGDSRSKLYEHGAALLSNDLSTIKGPKRTWIQMWSLVQRRGQDRRLMASMARQYLDAQQFIGVDAAGTLFPPFLRSEEYFPIFYDSAVRWMSYPPRSSVLWARVFIAASTLNFTSHLQQLGEDWLSNHGGNTKTWVTVWDFYIKNGDRLNLNLIAMRWLLRARWDMRAWVDVYLRLVNDTERPAASELIKIGEAWLSSGYGNTSSRRRVTQGVNYLRSSVRAAE